MENGCVFCKILREELPCHRIVETLSSVAFLDIMPISKGHTLVVPKKHVETLEDLNVMELNDLFQLVQRISKACKVGLNASGTNLLLCNGKDAGQVVPHVHAHVVPRSPEDGLRFHPAQMEISKAELSEVAERLLQGLS